MTIKANDGTGDNIERDGWETPQWLFDLIHDQYDFEMDWCASNENKKCQLWTDDISNTHVLPETMCWMNPPFSKALEMFNEFFKRTPKGVAIYRCDNMETKIWQDVIFHKATWIFIPKGRISYYLATQKAGKRLGSRFPSALIGLNVDEPNGMKGTMIKSRCI